MSIKVQSHVLSESTDEFHRALTSVDPYLQFHSNCVLQHDRLLKKIFLKMRNS